MDSINFFKGYGKVNPNNHLEDQTQAQKPSPKRRRLIAISALLFLSLLIAFTIGALIRRSTAESLSSNPAESAIRAVCNVTRFPDACISSITAAANNNNSHHNSPQSDPVSILKLSLEVAVAETSKLSSSLLRSMNSGDGDAATRDCRDLVEVAVSRLNESAAAIGGGDLTVEKREDLRTWIGAAETDQETCLDGLEETKSAVFDRIKAEIDKSKEYTSNALAIVANFPSILDKLNLVRH